MIMIGYSINYHLWKFQWQGYCHYSPSHLARIWGQIGKNCNTTYQCKFVWNNIYYITYQKSKALKIWGVCQNHWCMDPPPPLHHFRLNLFTFGNTFRTHACNTTYQCEFLYSNIYYITSKSKALKIWGVCQNHWYMPPPPLHHFRLNLYIPNTCQTIDIKYTLYFIIAYNTAPMQHVWNKTINMIINTRFCFAIAKYWYVKKLITSHDCVRIMAHFVDYKP